MKETILLIGPTFAMHLLMAQSSSAKQPEITFKDVKIELAYDDYLTVKDALVASRKDAAKEAALRLKASLGSLKNNQRAMNAADNIASASSIETLRRAFALLSIEMTRIVKERRVSKGMLYLEYCPMANNNEGAYWLSSEKEIKNPYFGDKMLKCGTVKETIH